MAAEKKKNTSSAGDKQKKKRCLGAFFALLLILCAAAASVFAVIALFKALFTENPRFNLQKILVTGTGYWKNHPEQLAEKIKLKKTTNLFKLDLRDVRQKTEKVPGIDSCSVMRILPDTLLFQVVERVPRAVLGSSTSPWLVDSKTIVMPRAQVMSKLRRLPTISGISLSGAKDGKPFNAVKPAVDLIMTAIRDFPDFYIYQISFRNPDKMYVYFKYRRYPMYRVILPVKHRGLKFELQVLQSAIINALKNGDRRTLYDMSYEGKVVIKTP